MGLSVGCIAGQRILSQWVPIAKRKDLVDRLNSSDPEERLDGLLIMNEVGGLGFNMVAANHVIFLGSMHSAAYEEQIIGLISTGGILIVSSDLP